MATFARIALRPIEDALRLLVLLFRSTNSLALVELFHWRHALWRIEQAQAIDDQREAAESDEDCVELVEPREHAAESLEAMEQALDLVAA